MTTTTQTSLPNWLQPYAEGFVQRAQQVADMPYQPYQGQTVAGLNQWQQQGLTAMGNRAMQGSPVTGWAQYAATNMMQGQGPQAAQNPMGPVNAAGGTAPVWSNTWNNSQVAPGTNPYLGQNNPYLQQQIDNAQGDVIRNWNTVAAPQFDTAMARSGSFGNEGIRQATSLAASDMQRNLGRIATDMRMQDYSAQLGLAENSLNRGMNAQQFNAGIMDSNLSRGMQRDQFNAGLSEAQAGRIQQANMANAQLGESFAGRQDSMANSNQQRILAALGLAPSLAAADYTDIDRLMQAGGTFQQQDQRQLTDAYNRFLESRQYPQQQLDIMGNALSRSYGQNTTQTGPAPNQAAQALGGALTFAQLMALLGG